MAQAVDICVIGGGIQGAGVAQSAALSGLSVVLVEKTGWAAGTSSKSSKLIHGGLRYLETLQLGLVRESLRERRTLLKIAGDIVKPNWFYLPIYKNSRHRVWQVRLGLLLYWLLAGWNNHGAFKTLPQAKWEELEGLNTADLKHVFMYQDAQTNDAELTRRVIASAEEHGATLLCPATFLSAEKCPEGYLVSIAINRQITTFKCRRLVNAGGPWANQIADSIAPKPPIPSVDLVKGTHLQFTEQLSPRCFYLEAQHDQRPVFVLPYQGGTLLGTTETIFTGDPDQVNPDSNEVDYLLETLHYQFPHFQYKPVNAWAGLRVLPAGHTDASRRSREVQFVESDDYLAIYGGKLTVYRATAHKAVEVLLRSLQLADAATRPNMKPDTAFEIADTAQVKL